MDKWHICGGCGQLKEAIIYEDELGAPLCTECVIQYEFDGDEEVFYNPEE